MVVLRAGQVYNNPPFGLTGRSSIIQDNCSSGALTSTQYAEVNSMPGTSCSIGFLGICGSRVLEDHDIEHYPIDDYIPLILVIAGGTTSYFTEKIFIRFFELLRLNLFS